MKVRATSVKAATDGRNANTGPCAGCGDELPHKFFCHGCQQFICEPCDCRDPVAMGAHDVDAHFAEAADA
jgi:hypothetical protein